MSEVAGWLGRQDVMSGKAETGLCNMHGFGLGHWLRGPAGAPAVE